MVMFLFAKEKAAARMGSGWGSFEAGSWQRAHLAR
jgi:hypothetical protein